MDRPSAAHGGGLRVINHDLALLAELAARCAFADPGTEIDCAVSGGADSLALLALATAAGCRATAHHVDHGLRDGSDAEASLVAGAASSVGAQFRAHTVSVAPGSNLEARARAARYEVLPEGVLTGHTADDRAETVLLNLLRGAGPTGAVGIARSPQRPLLDLRRRDTEALCAALGFEVVDDPSNRDPRFRRNRVRHELIPLLADIGERDPVPILTRQADLFSAIDTDVQARAAELDATKVRDLASAPAPVAGAAIRRWLIEAGVGAGYGVDSAAVSRIMAVVEGSRRATEVHGGWRVTRSAGRLSVVPPPTWQDADHG